MVAEERRAGRRELDAPAVDLDPALAHPHQLVRGALAEQPAVEARDLDRVLVGQHCAVAQDVARDPVLVVVEDEDVSGEKFSTFGSLADLVESKLAV